MRKLTLLLNFYFFVSSLYSQTGWMWQNPLPQGNELKAINHYPVWTVGAGGTVMKKNFYGWETINIGTTERLNDIYICIYTGIWMTERPFGWIVGDNGTIYYSGDEGATWTQQNSGTTETLHSVIKSGNSTWICGEKATLLKSDDDGQTWEKINTPVYDLNFFDMSTSGTRESPNELWIAGEGALIMSTADGGQTWEIHNTPTSWDLFSIDMNDARISWVSGKSGIILGKKTEEDNWQNMNESLAYQLNKIIGGKYLPSYAVGTLGTILKTINNNSSWTQMETGISWKLNDISSILLKEDTYRVVGQYGIMLENDGRDSEFKITNDLYWHWINSIEFINADTGWAVGGEFGGGNGIVLNTTDGGENWIVQKELQTSLWDMDFVNKDEGWAVGRNGLILHTASGGQVWGTQSSPIGGTLTSVSFSDEHNGWIVSMSNWGEIIHTSNGGSSWTKQTNPSNKPLYDVFFTNENKGWAVGLEAAVIKTTDGGANWETIDVNPSQRQRFTSVFFADEQHGWIAGTGGIIMRTSDGGNNWEEVVSGTKEYLSDIYFVDANRGWAVGHPGVILHTLDGGVTWYKQLSGVATNTLETVFFTDANKGWVGGEGGTILHTIRGGSILTNTFHVNDDNNSGIEDGSEEYPFTSVAEAIDNALAGDSVIIHPGTYDESPLLHMDIKDGLIIVGEDSANTFIPLPFYMGELTMKYHTEITGLTCPGYSFANSEGEGTIKIKGCHFENMDISAVNGYSFIVEDCTIEGSINNTGGANMMTIRNNHFLNGGINVLTGTTDEMSAVIIEGNRLDRSELPPGQNTNNQFAIPSGKVADISFTNPAIKANVTYTTITDNIINIQDEGSGIIVSGGSIAKISGNAISLPEISTPGHQTVGIKTDADTGMVKENKVTGGYYGLYSNSPATVFDNNTISNAHTGFYVKGAGKVQNNDIKNCTGNGLVADLISGPVQGNDITDNDSAGIVVLSSVDLGGGHKKSEGLNVLQNNGYYNLRIGYQPTQADTLFARYNLWNHETLNEILANDVLNEGGSNLTLKLDNFIIAPSTPGLISPANNESDIKIDTSLSWQLTAIYDSYYLQLAIDESFTNLILDTTGLKVPTFRITVQKGKTYFWRVKSVNPAGESNWSETWQFTTDIAGSVENEKDHIPVEIFPNPASNTLTIRSEAFSQKPANLSIVDLNGITLLEKSIPAGTKDVVLDISKLTNGVYFCHIQTQEYSQVKKIVIQK